MRFLALCLDASHKMCRRSSPSLSETLGRRPMAPQCGGAEATQAWRALRAALSLWLSLVSVAYASCGEFCVPEDCGRMNLLLHPHVNTVVRDSTI